MSDRPDSTQVASLKALFARLGRDTAGNTLMMMAAGLVPILAMVGGAVDMGRSYLAQARLQSACDAGVLAARKALGSSAAVSGDVPRSASAAGNAFFNTNFRDGAYGTVKRQFVMSLESDYSVSGSAKVDVPTAVMRVFGYTVVPLAVNCQAQLNFSDTDVMLVLDVTGSMNQTNPGDSKSRIAIMRDVIKGFHAQLEASKSPGTRLRYGFVPYSVNVNVGGLLRAEWMVDKWSYNARELKKTGKELRTTYRTTSTPVSGTFTRITPYTASSCPAETAVVTQLSSTVAPDGTESGRTHINGTMYTCAYDAETGTASVSGAKYEDYTYDWTRKATGMAVEDVYAWNYRTITVKTSQFKSGSSDDDGYDDDDDGYDDDGDDDGGGSGLKVGAVLRLPIGGTADNPTNLDVTFRGCMEERKTYEIDDYTNVDLARAIDLDIDRVPDKKDDTKWRPLLHELSFERSIIGAGVGTFLIGAILTTDEYLNAQEGGYSICPAPARKLAPMTAGEIASYVDSLKAGGNTYHDIGMIWGGRLISPTGIFASENANAKGKGTNRNLIMLTDGNTAPNQYVYGAYGIEPLDRRRWSQMSTRTLTDVVEKRFAVACDEVKKKNVTVWFVAFGTDLNPVMTECAGSGRYFKADNAAELDAIFSKIAAAVGDLRVTR